MKLMSNLKKMVLVSVLTLGVSLSVVGAKPRKVTPLPATAAVEVKTVGGDGCDAAAGVAVGLAVGALSPCSIVCAVAAWYTVGGMWLAGC